MNQRKVAIMVDPVIAVVSLAPVTGAFHCHILSLML